MADDDFGFDDGFGDEIDGEGGTAVIRRGIPAIDLSPANPWRKPDWRWLRAAAIADGDLVAARAKEDPLIRKAITFAQGLSETDEDVIAATAAKRPNIYWAYRLAKPEPYDDYGPAVKAELEARLLAAQPLTEISAKMDLTVDVIQTYEALFFDVTRRLKHVSYILHIVLGPKFHLGFTETDYALLWKLYGYIYGPHVMEALMQRAPLNPFRPKDQDGVKAAFRDDGVFSMLIRQAITTRTIKMTSVTSINLLEVYSKFVEIDRLAGQDNMGVSSSSYVTTVAALLGSIGISVGEFQQNVDSQQLRKYDKAGIELPLARLMQSAAGTLPAEYDALLELSYPEPQNVGTQQGSGGAAQSGTGDGR